MSATGATWIDGRIVAADLPAIRPDDHGFLVGDGVFETLLVRDGRPLFWDRHVARLERALAVAGIESAPLRSLETAGRECLDASGLREARMRITVSSGPGGDGLRRGAAPTVVVRVTPLATGSNGLAPARVLTMPGARNERSLLAGVKTTSYADAATLLARAVEAGADDVLLGDSCDRLSEALTANVVVVLAGRVLTPGPASGCLPGIVRDLLLQAGVAEEADLPLTALADVEEVFLTSSVAGVRPVASIDGRKVPIVDGPAADRARRAIAQAEAAELARRSGPTS
ncbi:MAG TPA: aminotransferase class IV [Acidimicrobiales bacterium]